MAIDFDKGLGKISRGGFPLTHTANFRIRPRLSISSLIR